MNNLECACECLETIKIQEHHRWKGIPKFIHGHGNKGKKNGMWKGDNVGYGALHDWIRSHKPKSKLCEKCNQKKPYDLANISGLYKRDINDFEWLCRSCHMKMDFEKGERIPKIKGFMFVICEFCKREFKRKHGRNKQRFCDLSCSTSFNNIQRNKEHLGEEE